MMKTLLNGDIIADDIPEILKSKYDQDPNNKIHWKLRWPLCIYKGEEKRQCPKSKRIRTLPWCELLNMLISPITCEHCSKRVPPDS